VNRLRHGVIEKAAEDVWAAQLDAVALLVEPKIRAEFIAAVNRMRDQVDLAALEAALRAGHEAAVLAAVGINAGSLDLSALIAATDETAKQAGEVTAGLLSDTLRAEVAFDRLNPNVIAHFQAVQGGMIRQITEDTRQGIMAAVRDAQLAGEAPAVSARRIKGIVGLTDRQAQAVLNFQRALEAGDYGDAMSRQLRDRRFDRTLAAAARRGSGLSPDQIETMVNRYRDRWLAFRAETISRTEAIRAAQAGSWQSMQQAAVAGRLPVAALRRFWLVAADERTCEVCKDIAKANAAGVGLVEPFMSPTGQVMHPPAHPRCRCAVTMRMSLPQAPAGFPGLRLTVTAVKGPNGRA
jgi:hypothetical protein